jgi:uncharacterized Zn finger protein (UPF0148 family)
MNVSEALDKIRKRTKVGRWVYCKYCYKCVLPIVNAFEGIIQCSCCGYGIGLVESTPEEQSVVWSAIKQIHEHRGDYPVMKEVNG